MTPTGAERQDEADLRQRLCSLMTADSARLRQLRLVQEQNLPDCWIGAGFVRTAVWDDLHGQASPPPDDVDVIWFDAHHRAARIDHAVERRLHNAAPTIHWSVKNQARMHRRNGDRPYLCSEDAMRYWPETATAVAVRLSAAGLEIIAPFGLNDLFALVVRPTPTFRGDKAHMVRARIKTKKWLQRWPRLRVVMSA